MERTVMQISSSVLNENGEFPYKYSCFGDNVNPPLEIHNIPMHAKSLAVVFESIGSEEETKTHWLIWNIPTSTHIIENESRGQVGFNDFGVKGYWGPKISGHFSECVFRIFAFDSFLTFPENKVTKHDLYSSVINYGLGWGKLTCKLLEHKERMSEI